ncbi:crotonase/enoyl-CoA hydratase family protein [Burkholderia ubonensis]|uniref:crotonase/enoyl-CoA hydratase family protein n=1 Tax=Burkholderia ubonensis TaxID=101571 RepID=UPI0015C8E21E|nr:crotonase/enoyl-CoA hydratase family protein [Burkholderia ubonensis]
MHGSHSIDDPLIVVEINEAVAQVTLNRAHKRNALSLSAVRQLKTVFESLPDTVKVAILDARGEHFCAGLDLAEVQSVTAAEGVYHSRQWYEAFRSIQFGRIPVICVMRGAVIGGGLELASATHIRIAEDSAYFGLPEGQRGIFLGGGGSVRIPKLIGFSRVMEMMLTGRVYGAEDAFRMGLVHYVMRPGIGITKALELAEHVASNATVSNFAIMHALPLIAEQTMEHGLLTEALMAGVTEAEEEANSRICAFLEKRAAKVTPE